MKFPKRRLTSSKDHQKEGLMHELWRLEGRPPAKLLCLWENRREGYYLRKGVGTAGKQRTAGQFVDGFDLPL